MKIEEALILRLTADTDIAAIIGKALYPGGAPMNAPNPCGVYRVISTEHDRHMTNASGLAKVRLELEWFGTDYATLRTLCEHVRDSLDHLRAVALGEDEDLYVRLITLDDESTEFLPPQDASEVGTHNFRQEITVWYRESVPTLA